MIRLFLIALCGFHYSLELNAQEGGYVYPFSVRPGEAANFYISTSPRVYDVQFVKISYLEKIVLTMESVAGGLRQVPDSSFWYGCNWPLSFQLEIPQNWESGVYIAKFPAYSQVRGVLFLVKERVLGSR